MEGFVGQITMFGGSFEPEHWAFCNGQMLDIMSHQALFSVIGTSYGGDGVKTFALPDLRGRVPMHAGAAPGLPQRSRGEQVASANVALADTADGQAYASTQASTAINFIICLKGQYPIRS